MTNLEKQLKDYDIARIKRHGGSVFKDGDAWGCLFGSNPMPPNYELWADSEDAVIEKAIKYLDSRGQK